MQQLNAEVSFHLFRPLMYLMIQTNTFNKSKASSKRKIGEMF